jgi:hypothetical protein
MYHLIGQASRHPSFTYCIIGAIRSDIVCSRKQYQLKTNTKKLRWLLFVVDALITSYFSNVAAKSRLQTYTIENALVV